MRLLPLLFPDRKTRQAKADQKVFARADAERARIVALIQTAPAPTRPAGVREHTLRRIATYLGLPGELKVVNDTVVCAACGSNCGQCGWGEETGVPFTSTLPHLKPYV
jgi:hypothetical protein